MKPKLLVILGTTSTGKTDLALSLAKKFNGELISADSRQLYKFLDIGTGKLPGSYESLEKGDGYWQIDNIKIWLYDVLSPDKRYNLYDYINEASQRIRDISKRGKLPIIIGGTGLYLRSLLEGVSNYGITADSGLRAELEDLDIQDIKKRISPSVLGHLNNSEINNKRRLIRLVELSLAETQKSGESFTGLAGYYDILKIGLETDRTVLKERISRRLIARINQGMIEESRDLLEKNVLSYERMEELGLEYRYLAKFIKGEIKSVEEFLNLLTVKISQYAKRQETWFKKDTDVNWFDISDNDFTQKVEKRVLDWYN